MKKGREKQSFICDLIDCHIKDWQTINEVYQNIQEYFFECGIEKRIEKGKAVFSEIKIPVFIPFSTFRKTIDILMNEKRIDFKREFVKGNGSLQKIFLIKQKTN